jgi:hypothetical protein
MVVCGSNLTISTYKASKIALIVERLDGCARMASLQAFSTLACA